MNTNFQFQYPWLLALLALLPVYALLHGRIGKLAALRFPSADIARAAGAAARAAAGRLLLFLRILTVALCITALAGPRFANDRVETEASGVDIMLVPYLASPLTLDHDWLSENLHRLHVGLIRDLGTAIGDAVAAGAKRLKGVKDSKSRIIILLTDGDNNKGEIDPVPAAQLAAALGAKVYTIGIGIEQPCQLPVFDPATGKLELDP